MTISGTDIINNLKLGRFYAITITGLTPSHDTVLQFEDANGWHDIDGTAATGSTPQEHYLFVTSSRLRVLVNAGTGDLEVNVTLNKSE